jgi:hypothetical protein
VLQAGAGQITARQAAVKAGIPMSVAATTVNKVCLSGLNAIYLADLLINAGEADIVVAGGMESMTQAPYLLPGARAVAEVNDAQRTAAALRAAAAEVAQAEGTVLDLRGPEPRLELVAIRPPEPEPEPVVQEPAAAVVPLRPRPAAPPITPPMTPEEMKAWVSDLSDGTLDALIAGAVACAVERAISPTVVRAGRYTISQKAV